MDDETRAYFEEMRRDLHDLQTVIEGVDDNTEKIAAHTRSLDVLRDQMNTRFARVRVDLSELQRARPPRRRPGR